MEKIGKFLGALEEKIDGPADTSRTMFTPILLGFIGALIVGLVLFLLGIK